MRLAICSKSEAVSSGARRAPMKENTSFSNQATTFFL